MLQKHNKVIGNYEFRTCDKHLIQQGELIKAEIVKWQKDSCYTICIYNQHPKESYWNVEEVCDRMVGVLDDKDFRELFKYGHNYLVNNVKEEKLEDKDLDKLIKLKACIKNYIADFENYDNREIRSVCFDLEQIVNEINKIYLDNIEVSKEKP